MVSREALNRVFSIVHLLGGPHEFPVGSITISSRYAIGSSAAVALGLSPNPNTNKLEKDREMARFNIDLLVVLRPKTKGNF